MKNESSGDDVRRHGSGYLRWFRYAGIMIGGVVVGALVASIGGFIVYMIWANVGHSNIKYPGELAMFGFWYALFLGPIHGGIAGCLVTLLLLYRADVWPLSISSKWAVVGGIVGQLLVQGLLTPTLPGSGRGAAMWLYGTPMAIAVAAVLAAYAAVAVCRAAGKMR